MNFDLANAPLPPGVTVLEASAGTGKTYALAGIYLRLIVEHGLAPREILVTTYTEAATAELRGRIRERLENAERVFRGEPPKDDDKLLPALTARITAADALPRLNAALRSFDEAAIHTIHGFCERTLRERAFESGSTFDTELMPDQNALLREVTADFWRCETYGSDPVPAALTLACGIGVDDLARLLPRVLGNPHVIILPAQSDLATLHASARKSLLTFAASWPAWRDEVRALFLTAAGNEWANKPARAEATEPLLDALDGLAADLVAPAAAYAALAHFTNEWIAANTCKRPRKDSPQHPFFELSTQFAEVFDHYAPAARAEFLRWAREELAKRKAARGVRSFDDLLTQLDAALASASGPALITGIRSRFRVALVDEFQDTDAVQDAIFSRVFGGDGTWLFLIGDPKQAIYGFRGADVFTYLAATQRAEKERRFDLGMNHRSAARLVESMNDIFANHPRPFIESRIEFRKVAPSNKADAKPLRVAGAARAPMRFWHWEEDGAIKSGVANRELPRIVAAEIRRLLDTATLDGKPLQPSDCAVLTFTNKQAQAVQAALATLNIPAVLLSNASVFTSREAAQLRILLAALAGPWRDAALRAALLTDFLGLDAAALDDNTKVETFFTAFREAHTRWIERGFIVMLRAFFREARVRETLLARPDGERALTNLLQLAELLHEAGATQRLGPAGLVRWLGQQIAAGSAGDEAELRLERDDEAVHVVTVHKSKGLEYPVVFCPFAWNKADRRSDDAALFHDNNGALTLDLAAQKDSEPQRRMLNERLAEHMRLLYVALTRAKHECHVVTGIFNQCAISALLWLLDPPIATDDVAAALHGTKHEQLGARLHQLAQEKPECFSVEPPPSPDAARWRPPGGDAAAPGARVFHGSIAKDWRVLSFSGLVEGAENEGEDRDAAPSPEPGVALAGIHALPRGKRAGNCLHDIFEHLDFTDTNALDSLVRRNLAIHGLDAAHAEALAACVARTLDVGLAPGLRLRDVPRAATLREMEFHLPAARLTAEKLGAFTAAGLRFEPREGILKGYMDLVFEHGGQFFLVDWKSNWLGADEAAYTRDAMDAEMQRHRYDLQWQLYAVALRRWLRHRLGPGGESKFAGAFYIFARGATPAQPQLGVMRITPDAAKLDALDALLGGAS